MQITYGSYTGNGSDNRGITGIGFAPELVIIKGNTNQFAVFKTDKLTGDNTLYFTSTAGVFSNGIQSLDADGFTLGTNATVNANSITYYWMAVRVAGGGDFKTGTYQGEGNDNRSITGVGFQPTVLVVVGDAHIGLLKDNQDSGEGAHYFNDNWASSNTIQSIGSDGFTIGSSNDVNQLNHQYYWFAFRADTGEITVNSYTGNGVDDRNITGVGFNPNILWILSATTGSAHENLPCFKTSSMAGDLTMVFETASGSSNNIQSFASDGFQVGTSDDVNANTETYHYIAFKEQSANTTTSTSTSTTTTTSTSTSTSTTSTSSSTSTSTSSSTSTSTSTTQTTSSTTQTTTSTTSTSSSTSTTTSTSTSTSTTTTLEYVYSIDEGV